MKKVDVPNAKTNDQNQEKSANINESKKTQTGIIARILSNMGIDPLNPFGMDNEQFQIQQNKEFVEKIRGLRGKTYEEVGKCNGSFENVLISMGYNIPKDQVRDVARGSIKGIKAFRDVDLARQGNPGVLNAYDWKDSKGKQDGIVDHINIGVGKLANEPRAQVIDATENVVKNEEWVNRRNADKKGYGQIDDATVGNVNQTGAPYSNSSIPVTQLYIDFVELRKNYGKR